MYMNRLILLFAAGTFLFSPVIISWWTHGSASWLGPYLFWAAMIALGWWVARSRDLNDL